MPLKYEDFVLEIVPGRAGGHVVLAKSLRGEDSAPFGWPSGAGEASLFRRALLRAARARRRSGDRRNLVVSGEGEAPLPMPEEIGERLFRALLPENLLRLYERSLDRLEGQPEVGLRLKLILDPRDPAVAPLQALPWELLRQPGTAEFLALSRRRPLIRYLAIPKPVLAARRPSSLRVVVVAAVPRSERLPPLELERERRNLEDALAPLGQIEIVDAEPTLEGLRRALLARECHVLHFMGHGSFDVEDEGGVLYFEAADGGADPVRGVDLVNKLADFPTLRLVVLNACESARASEDTELGSFAGVAVSLVMGGLASVVAMQFPVSDEAAISFSRTFYGRLAAEDPVDAAVTEGRQSMHSDDAAGLDWVAPVLFLRSPDGVLFPEKDILPGPLARRRLARWSAAVLLLFLLAVGAWQGHRRLSVERLTSEGIDLFQHERLAEAREKFLAALELAPGSAEVHSSLAAVEEQLGNEASAETHYQAAVRLRPHSAEHLYNLGHFRNDQGDFRASYRILVRAFQEDSSRAEIRGELGRAALGLGLLVEARKRLESALAIDPELAPLHRLLGEVALDEGKVREAVRHLDAARNRYPQGDRGRIQTLSLLVEAQDRLGDTQAVCRTVAEFHLLEGAEISEWAPAVEKIAARRTCPEGER